jgi:hypothetical protein
MLTIVAVLFTACANSQVRELDYLQPKFQIDLPPAVSLGEAEDYHSLVVAEVTGTVLEGNLLRSTAQVLASDRGETGEVVVLSRGFRPARSSTPPEWGQERLAKGDLIFGYALVRSPETIARQREDPGYNIYKRPADSIEDGARLLFRFILPSDRAMANQGGLSETPLLELVTSHLQYCNDQSAQILMKSLTRVLQPRGDGFRFDERDSTESLLELLSSITVPTGAKLEYLALRATLERRALTEDGEPSFRHKSPELGHEIVRLASDGLDVFEIERLSGIGVLSLIPEGSLDPAIEQLYFDRAFSLDWSKYRAKPAALRKLLEAKEIGRFQHLDPELARKAILLDVARMTGDREIRQLVNGLGSVGTTEARREEKLTAIRSAVQEFIGSP